MLLESSQMYSFALNLSLFNSQNKHAFSHGNCDIYYKGNKG